MSTLLILTVGTGTTAARGNLAHGLSVTLEKVAPRLFWLVPSSAPDSCAMADLVREGVAKKLPGAFHPRSAEADYWTIDAPDNLECCRTVVREAIRQARAALRPGERLLVNPVSGTKQMSVGAAIAALDEDVGEIIFTVGEREGGIVIDGTEQIESFDAANYFLERDLPFARELFAAASHVAAAKVLSRHRPLQALHAKALCAHEWNRLNYADAAGHAARFAPSLARHLRRLASAAASPKPDAAIVADLLDAADYWLAVGDTETSLGLSYKALEQAVRLRLLVERNIAPPYRLAAFTSLALPPWLHERFRKTALSSGEVRPGLRQLAETLKALGDVFAEALLANKCILDLADLRNRVTHEIRIVTGAEASDMLQRVGGLARKHLTLPGGHPRPRELDPFPPP